MKIDLGPLARAPSFRDVSDDRRAEIEQQLADTDDWADLPDDTRSALETAMIEAVDAGSFAEPDEGESAFARFGRQVVRKFSGHKRDAQAVAAAFGNDRVTDIEGMGEMFGLNFASGKGLSRKPWSNFKESDYTDEQFKNAALVPGENKSDSKLPVKEPDGTPNLNGMRAAAAALAGARGGVQLSDDQKAKAKRALAKMFRDHGVEPPESLTSGGSSGGSSNKDDDANMANNSPKNNAKPGHAVTVDGKEKKVADLTDEELSALVNSDSASDDDKQAARMEQQRRKQKKAGSGNDSGGSSNVPPFLKKKEGANMSNAPFSVLMPVDMSAGEDGGDHTTWRKRVLPFGTVNYKGRTLKFTRDMADKIANNFKNSAFDQVVFNLVDPNNKHNDDPMRVAGEVSDFTVGNDGLYATISTNEVGSKYLSRINPNVGVSARFIPDYTREHDNTHFGPVIQHVAATVDPHITGLGPWEAVEMSNDAANDAWADPWRGAHVVNMSNEQFADVDAGGVGNDDPSSDSGNDDTDTGAGAVSDPATTSQGVNMTMQFSGENAGQLAELSRRAESAEKRVAEWERKMAEKSLDHHLNTYIGKGVPPHIVDMARSLLKKQDILAENSPVDFSNDGDAVLAEDSEVKGMLEGYIGHVDMGGERGVGYVPSPDEREQAQARHDNDYSAYLSAVRADQ